MGNNKNNTIVTKNGDMITPKLMRELLVIKACTLLSFIGHCKSVEQANLRMAIAFPNFFSHVCGYMKLEEAQEIVLQATEQRYGDENGE